MVGAKRWVGDGSLTAYLSTIVYNTTKSYDGSSIPLWALERASISRSGGPTRVERTKRPALVTSCHSAHAYCWGGLANV